MNAYSHKTHQTVNMLLIFFDGRLMAEHLDYVVRMDPMPVGHCRQCAEITQTAEMEKNCPKCKRDFSYNDMYRQHVILTAKKLPANTVVQLVSHTEGLFGLMGGSSEVSVVVTQTEIQAGEVVTGAKITKPEEPKETSPKTGV